MNVTNSMPHHNKIADWVVSEEDHGEEIIVFIQNMLKQHSIFHILPSKKSIKKVIDQGGCFVNNRLVRKSNFLLARKDRIHFQVHFLVSAQQDCHASAAAKIVYRDNGLIAISKPPYVETADKSIRELLICKSKVLTDKEQFFLVHRLDRNTSGVLILAETRECQNLMETLFKKRLIEKTYVAVVEGAIRSDEGVISVPLIRERQYEGQEIFVRAVSPHENYDKNSALPAVTRWKKLAGTDDATLVAVFPETGRTHQIRAHFRYIGHPLLGDARYASKQLKENHEFRFPRHLLHAFSLKFRHPITNKSVVVYDHVYEDMRLYIERLFGPIGERLICEL